MWARLLLVVSLFAESKEMVVGGKNKNVLWVPGPLWARPLWARPLWAGPSWAPLGPYGPGPYGPGPHGPGPYGPGPYGPGPYGPPWALMGRALMGHPGPKGRALVKVRHCCVKIVEL